MHGRCGRKPGLWQKNEISVNWPQMALGKQAQAAKVISTTLMRTGYVLDSCRHNG
jgi:hypothetical protein